MCDTSDGDGVVDGFAIVRLPWQMGQDCAMTGEQCAVPRDGGADKTRSSRVRWWRSGDWAAPGRAGVWTFFDFTMLDVMCDGEMS
jgi:hypothetical protein